MKSIVVFETSDGEQHRTRRDAENYAENRYRMAIGTLCHQMVMITKERALEDFVHEHLDEFIRLGDYRDDVKVDEDDDEKEGEDEGE